MKVFHHSTHKKFWDLISNNPGTSKKYALSKLTHEEKQQLGFNYCAACVYAEECCDCPFNIDQDDSWSQSNCLGGLYDYWMTAPDLAKEADYAKKIRDLPVRKGVETD